MRRFWETASEAQKLAQIEGGIECGLSYAEIAIACNGDYVNPTDLLVLTKRISYFAWKHGIKRGRSNTAYGCEAFRIANERRKQNGNTMTPYWLH